MIARTTTGVLTWRSNRSGGDPRAGNASIGGGSPGPAGWPRTLELGLSQPDGTVHVLHSGRLTLCGRVAKPIRTTRIPTSLPPCEECRRRAGLPRTRREARAAVARLLRCQ
jgi:hypothetical protein